MEILFAAVFLMAAWHGLKRGMPTAMRAIGDRRRASVNDWRSNHPDAPATARWFAGAARTAAAVRYGPKHVKRSFLDAYKEAWEEGKQKYQVAQPPATRDSGGNLTFGGNPQDPTGVGSCPQCRGRGVINGKPCPSCVERQRQRNEGAQPVSPTPNPSRQRLAATTTLSPGQNNLVLGSRCIHPTGTGADGRRTYCGEPVDGENDLRCRQHGGPPDLSPPRQPGDPRSSNPQNVTPIRKPAPPTNRREPMAVSTVTGGEVASPEQLVAELHGITSEAAAEMEDATADAKRAEEDCARVETLTASLTNLRLRTEDVGLVQALLEPARQRAAAATSRAAAADQRLAAANAALTMANRHVELQGQGAAGEFYNAS